MHMPVQMLHTHHASIYDNDMGNVRFSELSCSRQQISTLFTHDVRDKSWGMHISEVGNHELVHVGTCAIASSAGLALC